MPPQKLLHPEDWSYEAISILSREQGRVFFTDSRITVTQMRNHLAEIDVNSLSASGLVIYDRLDKYLNSTPLLNFQTGFVNLNLDVQLQLETYLKSNENIPWIYNDHARHPVLKLPMGFSLRHWLTTELDIYFGENPRAATFHNNNSNIPSSLFDVDIHIPKRGYLSLGLPVGRASGAHLAIGMGDNFFGRTETGSIIISEYLKRTIYGQATIYSPAFKWTAEVMQYEVNKYSYMHYIQIRPHRSISISLAEGVMVNAPLELRFLNPATIFHSHEAYKTYTRYNEEMGYDKNNAGDPWGDGNSSVYEPTGMSRIGSYFGVKLEWQPVRYLRLYGLFAMTQFQLPVEKNNWQDSLTPDALAFQAGFNLSIPVSNGYLDFAMEGVYTYPYMYVLWDKDWSFFKEVHEVDNMTLRYWTGTPFGPDTIAGAFRAGFRSSTNWFAGLSFVFSAQGERSSFDIFDHDSSIDDTYRPTNNVFNMTISPTGVPIYTFTITLLGEYYPLEWLGFALQPGYRLMINAKHQADRVEHGFELVFTATYKPKFHIIKSRQKNDR